MNVFVLGAGCSKAYSESLSGQRMPIAKDFFKIFNSLPNLNSNRSVLIGAIINALDDLKGTGFFDPFKEEFDIEEIHSLFESKLEKALQENDFRNSDLYFRAYTQLTFLFAAVVNEISNGPVSKVHNQLIQRIESTDVFITFNWDTLLDRALKENTGWNTDTGYFAQPVGIYDNGWREASVVRKTNSPLLLKMHGSANWLTGAVYINPREDSSPQMTQETAPDSFFVFEKANGPYDCYDGRWSKVYEPFCYGYYPPNLPLEGKKVRDGYALFRAIMRSPVHAPKGKHGASGLISMPLIIPPVKSKNYDFYGGLFDSIWSKANESLVKANTITFIGYSFPVTDTKSIHLFKNAFAKRSTIPFINIIDPQPQRIKDLMIFEMGIPESHLNIVTDYFSENFDLNRIKFHENI